MVSIGSEIERLTGYPPEDFVALRSYESIIHPDDRELVQAHIDASVERGMPFQLEYRILRKDGEIRWVHEEGQSSAESELVGRISDSGSYQWTEQMLKRCSHQIESETGDAFFRALVRCLGQELEMQYVFCGRLIPDNRAQTVAMWGDGALRENFIYALKGTPCDELVQEGSCFFTVNVAEQFPGDTLLVEMGINSYIGVPLYDGSQANGLLVAMDQRPIAELPRYQTLLEVFAARAGAELKRRAMEEALKKSEEELNQAQSIARFGSFVWDLRSGQVDASRELRRLFWYGEEVITPELFLARVHPEDRALIATQLGNLEELEDYFLSEYRIVGPDDDRVRWIRNTIQIERDEDGNPVLIRGSSQDVTERRRAEEALKESEAELNRAQHIARMGSYTWDLVNEKLYWSKELRRLLWCGEEEEPSFGLFLSRIHPEDRERVIARGEQLQDFKRLSTEEYRIQGPDGTVRWMRDRILVERDEDGRAVALRGTNQDITDLKRAEEALKESEEELNLAQSIAQVGSFSWNAPKDEVFWSKEFLRLFWFDEEQEPDFGLFLSRIHPEDRGRVSARIEQFETWDALEVGQYRIQGPDGTVRWMQDRVSTERDESGNIQWVRGASQDITERKVSELEHERLRSAIAQSVEAIVITDVEGQMQYVNPAFEAITEYSRDEAIGQNIRILQPKGAKDSPMWEAVAQGEIWKGRMIRRKKHGALFTEDGTFSPVRDASGKIVNYVAVMRDITAELRLEAQLRQAQKMESIGRLAGGIAHDFNNMLGVILGHTELALEQLSQGDSLLENIEEIAQAAQQSVTLTRQLLTFARKQTITPRKLNLNDTVTQASNMLLRLIGENIHFSYLPEPSLWPVNIDPNQIHQLLTNLCVNARDAINGIGQITVSLENIVVEEAPDHDPAVLPPAGEYVMLSVCDDGHGMDEQTRRQVFEPFFTTKDQGTGLGLAMVYGVAKQNNGFVYVTSKPKEGARFDLYFPRCVEEIPAQTESSPSDKGTHTGGETILLVEDEPSLRKIIKMVIQKLGYHVLVAESPKEALTLAQSHPGEIQLLITDVVMPEMNGRELAAQLQPIRPEMKRLYMSGYPADIVAEHGVLDQSIHFLQKPFLMNELADKVRSLLES